MLLQPTFRALCAESRDVDDVDKPRHVALAAIVQQGQSNLNKKGRILKKMPNNYANKGQINSL